MTERNVDGGSASPPTADVPTCGDQLAVAPDNCTYVCSERTGHGGPHFDAVRRMSWTRAWPQDLHADPPDAMGWPLYVDDVTPGIGCGLDCAWWWGAPDDRRTSLQALLADVEVHRAEHLGKDLDHSGVAGEPEATTKEASESAQDVGPTPTHAPTPETPGAVNVAGGVVIQVQVVDISAACRERVGDAWREMYPGMAEHDYRLRFTRPGGWEVTMRRGATAEDVVRNLRESRD